MQDLAQKHWWGWPYLCRKNQIALAVWCLVFPTGRDTSVVEGSESGGIDAGGNPTCVLLSQVK